MGKASKNALKAQSGITLITLAVTIILLAILTFTIVINLNPYGNEKRRAAFEADLRSLKEEVDQYYARYGELPIKYKNGNPVEFDSSSEEFKEFNKILHGDENNNEPNWNILNVNDKATGGDLAPYYEIDTDLLDVDLNYKNDTFIINSQSHTVYLPKGVEYAEGIDEEYKEDVPHYRISEVYTVVNGENQKDKDGPQIIKIGDTVFGRQYYLKYDNITSKSFNITAKVRDLDSGLYKILFHYRKDDEVTYRTIEYILPRAEQGTTDYVTVSTKELNISPEPENLTKLKGELNLGLETGGYWVYIDAYDVAGNKSTFDNDPEYVTVPPVDPIGDANVSPTDWTKDNVTVTLPVSPIQFVTSDKEYKRKFITQYYRVGTNGDVIDTEWQTYFDPTNPEYDKEHPPEIVIDRNTTIKYRYFDGINTGPEKEVKIENIDKSRPTVDVDPSTIDIIDGYKEVVYGSDISISVRDIENIAEGLYGSSGVSHWRIDKSDSETATAPGIDEAGWQELTPPQTAESITSAGHVITIVQEANSDTYKDVGRYFIWAKDKAKNINIQIAQIIINPKSIEDLEVTLNPSVYTYDGTEKEPTVTIVDGSKTLEGVREGQDSTGKDFTYRYENNINAGTASVVITGKGNYEGSQKVVTFIINKATPTLVLDPTSSEVDYNEEKTFTATAKVTGAPAVTGTVTAVSGNTDKVQITGGASTENVNATQDGGNATITYRGNEATENATVITVTFTPSDSNNYETATATFTVTKVNKISNPITVTANELTYNGNAQNLVTTSNAEGEVWYSIGTPLTDENYRDEGTTTIPKQTNAGDYEVYYYTPGNTNYLPASGHTTVTITPKLLTVENFNYSPLTKPYDGGVAAPTGFTITATAESGLVAGDTVNVTYEDATYNDEAVANANKITVTGIAIDNSNYTLNTTTCEKPATITPLPITGSVTITGENTYGNVLTAVVGSDLNPQDVTLTYQWFSNNSDSTEGGTALTEPSSNNTYTIGKGLVGKYIYVVVTARKENYSDYEMKDTTDTTNNTTETVAPKKITAPTSTNKIYNGQEQTSFEGTADYTVTGNTGTNADNYEGTAVLEDKQNTVWADSNSSEDKTLRWTIEPAEITLIWGATTTWIYDGTEHIPTVTTPMNIPTTGETITLTVSGGQTNAGNYTATASIESVTKGNGDSGEASNYTITNPTQNFTITKANIVGSVTIIGENTEGSTLTAKVSDDLAPPDAHLEYQWYYSNEAGTTGGTQITGATNREYILPQELIGKHIYVEVTASKDNYETATFKDETDTDENKSAIVRPIYTITLNNQGADAETPGTTQIYQAYSVNYTIEKHGAPMTQEANPINLPVKIGYTFGGYYTGQNGTGQQYISETGFLTENADNQHFEADGTLYANWVAHTYTIEYYNNGEKIGESQHTYGTEKNLTTMTLLEGLAPGYDKFEGWAETNSSLTVKYTDGQSVINLTETKNGVVPIYAIWSRTANFHSGESNTITTETQYKNNNTYSVQVPTPIPIETWEAQYWRAESKEVHYALTGTITDNVGPDFYAVYSRNITLEYKDLYEENIKVNFNAAGGNVSTTTKTVAYNRNYGELPIPTKAGYAFGGWYTGENGTGSQVTEETLVTQYTEHTLYAKWVIGVNYYNNGELVASTVYINGTANALATAEALGIEQEGYTNFYGWAIANNTVERSYTDGQSINELETNDGTIDLHAIWSRTANFYSGNPLSRTEATQYKNNERSSVQVPTPIAIDTWTAQYWRATSKEVRYPLTGEITDNVGPNFYAVYSRDITLEYKDLYEENIKVNFNAAGGSINKTSKTVAYNGIYGELPTPTKAGYAFGGWYTGENGTGLQVTEQTTVTQNTEHTLYAKWVLGINYYNNGELIASTVYTNGTASTLATAEVLGIEQEGYTNFYGWAIANNTVERTYTDGQSIDELQTNDGTIDLHAIWSRTANFYSGKDSSKVEVTQYKNTNTASLQVPTPIAIDTWTAQYWRATSKEVHYPLTGEITDNVGPNFYAVYSRDINIEYENSFEANVTVNFNAAGGSVNKTSKKVAYNGIYGELPTPTKTGYTFDGWYTGENGTGTKVTEQITVTQNTEHTLYAKWVLGVNYYNNGTLIEMSTYVDGTESTLATPEALGIEEEGYTNFYGWATSDDTFERTYTDGQSINEIQANEGTINLYAIWSRTANFYSGSDSRAVQVTQYKNANTSSVQAPEPIAIDTWTAQYWRATSKEVHYPLTGEITDNVGPDFYAVYSRDINIEYEDSYEANVTVNFNAAGGNLTTASKKVAYNGIYGELPTPTKTGYIFEGWYTGENGTGTKVTSQTTVTQDTVHTLYAKWVKVVNYYNNGALVAISTYTDGTASTLATPEVLGIEEEGYTNFYGWATANNTLERTYTNGQNIDEIQTNNGIINLYAIWSRTANFYSGANSTITTVPQYKNNEKCSLIVPEPIAINTWTAQHWKVTSKELQYPLTGEITDNVGPNFNAVYTRDITLDYQQLD